MPSIFARIAPTVPFLLWIIAAWQFAHTSVHMDTARDFTQAALIARGEAWPLEGPGIARAFHLGPLWFYVLALPLIFGGGFSAVAWWTALLFGAQFYFAARIGARLHKGDAGCAALFALALTLPNWSVVHMLGTTHTLLAAPMLMAAIWTIIRFHDAPTLARAAVMGVACAWAVHAHPTTGLFAVLALAVIAHSNIMGTQKWLSALVFSIAFGLWFAPLFFAPQFGLAGAGYSASQYVGAQSWSANAQQALRVLVASVADAPRVQVEALAAHVAWLARVSPWIWGAVAFLGVWGWRRQWNHAVLWIGLSGAVASTFLASVSRPFVTFYMIVPITVLLPLALAHGWCAQPARMRAWLGAALLVLGVSWSGVITQLSVHDGLHANLERIVYVGKTSQHAPWPVQPHLAQRDLNALSMFLCREREAAFHGPVVPGLDLLAWPLLAQGCPQARTRDVQLGGLDGTGPHWLGAPCVALPGKIRTGHTCWHAAQPISSMAMRSADTRNHPVRSHSQVKLQTLRVRTTLGADDTLVVTNHQMEWSRTQRIQVAAVGPHTLRVLYATPWFRVLQCADCAKAGVTIEVAVETDAPQAIDVTRVPRLTP